MRRRLALLALASLSVLLLGACRAAAREADKLIELAPRLVAPGRAGNAVTTEAGGTAPSSMALPPAQAASGFDVEPLGLDGQGRRLYRVRIKAGGSPALVALSLLTPLFRADGKDAVAYVSEAYFRANPRRSPGSIQPGDEFLLPLPADTFVVRWQEERSESVGQPVRLREYVSERGDRLIYYLTDPFPLSYELRPADGAGRATLVLHVDLAYMLGTGRIDPVRLARLVYRVENPDIFQVERMRTLATELKPGVQARLEVDRTRTYLDAAREAFARAGRTEPVAEPERAYLTRALIEPDQGSPYLAIEDALGMRTSLAEAEEGRPFRIEYERDGTVRVSYRTGPEDALSKRDPYLLRENERWAALYHRLLPNADTPVKWGPGEPSDLDPFPSARDPLARLSDPEHRYDYLVPGRVLVLTFRPARSQADLRAELEFRDLMGGLRERFKTQIAQVLEAIGRLEASRRSGQESAVSAAPAPLSAEN